MGRYISIPLDITLTPIVSIGRESGDVEKSIDNLLDLIVFTPKGAFSADPEFGFEYWNHEYSNIDVREFNNSYIGMMSDICALNDISRRQCEESLLQSIQIYEPRLLHPEVKIVLEPGTSSRRKKSPSKYEMRVIVTGFIDDGFGVGRQYEKRISFLVEPMAKKTADV